MRADRTERRVRQISKARRRTESQCQEVLETRSRRPRLVRLPRSRREGPTPTRRARGSQCGVSIDPEGMTPDEGLPDTSAAVSISHGPDKRYTAVSAGEAERLAEYNP